MAANTANESGLDGSGAAIGIADTGIDVTHADFLDAQGHTRVAWLLTFCLRMVCTRIWSSNWPTDDTGKIALGAVWPRKTSMRQGDHERLRLSAASGRDWPRNAGGIVRRWKRPVRVSRDRAKGHPDRCAHPAAWRAVRSETNSLP